MKLTVRDVAKLLRVSEKVVNRWIDKDELPAYKMNDQYRVNHTELMEWAASRQIPIPAEFFHDKIDSPAMPILSQAIETGGIFYGVKGRDKESVLRAVVHVMKLPQSFDPDHLLHILLAREVLASSGIGNGIAIPHVRNPIIFPVPHPVITLCFLEAPVDFGALDGKAVHTLFTLVSPNVRHHLYLLSRLAFALRDARFKNAIDRRGTKDEILNALRQVESGFSCG